MGKIHKFVKNHWDIFSYLFFGAITTLVNYLVYFPLFNWLHWAAATCNMIAWFASVVFAYLTNKPFVFKSTDWSHRTVIPEITKFFGCRIGSGLMETFLIWFFVDIRSANGNLIKIVVSVLVVVLNYVFSKWIVFRRREKG